MRLFAKVAALVTMAIVFSTAAFAAGDATAKAEKDDIQDRLVKIKEEIAEAVKEGKSVFLYFYSDSIPASTKDIEKVKEIAAENSAEVVEIEAMEMEDLRYGYEVQYVPTVFLMRPDSGLSHSWVVDLPEEEMERALSDAYNPLQPQAEIAQGIKEQKPQLLFFMATWCGYCVKLQPQIDRFAADYSDRINVVQIDVDRAQAMGNTYSVSGFPTLVFTEENGLILERGGYPQGYADYVEFFKSIGVDMQLKPKVKEAK